MTVRVEVLGGFALHAEGGFVPLSQGPRRIVSLLAVTSRPLRRDYIAGQLWMDATEEESAARLRSALWQLRRVGTELVRTAGAYLDLAAEVQVDFRDALRVARFLTGQASDGPHPAPGVVIPLLSAELLPESYEDDWIVCERELWRQLRLHALEAFARQQLEQQHYVLALEAALCAINVEPLRETAHRLLMEVHLAEGNPSEAIRQLRLYESLLGDELGLRPSARLRRLVSGIDDLALADCDST